MGYNSRYSQLSWEEIKSLNAFVAQKVKSINPEHLVIVGDPLHCSTKVSIEFANHAKEVGADIISLIVRERFFSEDQIFNHYKMIADNSDTAILIHEMPFLNGYGGPSVQWPISLLDSLADLDQVVAIKEDAKDDEFSKMVVEKLKDRAAIVISGGGLRQWLDFADLGCQAWLNGISVFEPGLELRFWQYWLDGNREGLNKVINEIEVPFFDGVVSKFGWHLGIKAALQSMGIMHRRDRMPLQHLSEEAYQEVGALMKTLPIEKILSTN
jgi:4-hydroxy-tetrahydrodipicolinate synthase